MAGWPTPAERRLPYRRGVSRRSVRDLAALVSQRFGLPEIALFAAVLCDLVIIATSAFDGIDAVVQELWLLSGVVALSACALWSATRPGRAVMAGAAVLVSSSVLFKLTDTPSFTALLEGITFAETVAGVELLYYAVLRLPPIAAFCASALLVAATLLASAVRTDFWKDDTPITTLFAGAVVFLLIVLTVAYQRMSRRPRLEQNPLTTLLRQQWLLVAPLATLLLLEMFTTAETGLFGLLVLLCSVGTVVAAVLAPRAPAWSAVYYSVFIVVAGAIRWFTGVLVGYADLYGLSYTVMLSGMAVVVSVVRHEPPARAAWLLVLQSSAVAMVVLPNMPKNLVEIRITFVMALLALGICVAIGMFLRARDSERARVVAAAVSDAQTAERMALARELHDVVAHHVTGIVVQAQAARMLAEQNPAVVVEALGQIEKAGTDAMKAMRRLVQSMRGDAPAGASEFSEQATSDLAADLRRLVDAGNHGVPTGLELDIPPDLPQEVSRSTLRVVQESLTNVGKHAENATKASVTVRAVDGELHIRVADDGTGGTRQRAGRPTEDSGYGLVGMRERIDLLRGRLSAGPSAEGGWLVEAWIPLASEAGRKDDE